MSSKNEILPPCSQQLRNESEKILLFSPKLPLCSCLCTTFSQWAHSSGEAVWILKMFVFITCFKKSHYAKLVEDFWGWQTSCYSEGSGSTCWHARWTQGYDVLEPLSKCWTQHSITFWEKKVIMWYYDIMTVCQTLYRFALPEYKLFHKRGMV